MPADAERIARLTYIATHTDEVRITTYEQAACRWAVERIAELEGALRGTDYGPMQHGLADLLERAADCHEVMCAEFQCDSTVARPLRQEARHIRAALAPAPTKEGEIGP